jgi:hypothetical protein
VDEHKRRGNDVHGGGGVPGSAVHSCVPMKMTGQVERGHFNLDALPAYFFMIM